MQYVSPSGDFFGSVVGYLSARVDAESQKLFPQPAQQIAPPVVQPIAKPLMQPIAKPLMQPIAKPLMQPIAQTDFKEAIAPISKTVKFGLIGVAAIVALLLLKKAIK